jgi:hypothetical protein
MKEKFEFIYSTRFWSLVIGAVSIYLKTKGYIGEPEMLLIATITGGFIGIKTIDRVSEKIGSSTTTTTNITGTEESETIKTIEK